MYAGMDFAPADSVESELFGLDFVYDLSRLSPDEELVSAVVDIGVDSGVDATPSSRLSGSPYVAINPYNETGLTTMVVQRIAGTLPGVAYWLRATATTNRSNQISLWARIPAGQPPQTWSTL